jgi:hypothetical protein
MDDRHRDLFAPGLRPGADLDHVLAAAGWSTVAASGLRSPGNRLPLRESEARA